MTEKLMKFFLTTLHAICGAIIALAGAPASEATVLFSSLAESGTCNTGVASSVWNYTESGASPNSRFYYRCTNPVPNSGRTKSFRVTTVNGQQDAWNHHYPASNISLTPGITYYMGAFIRFDRINGVDVWRDTNAPDSYDKLIEFHGNVRWIILAGWPNSNYSGSYDHKFTFDLYSSPGYCSSCGPNEKWANVAPYSKSNPFLADYDRWYAVVMAFTPSSGGSATNGRVELFINGIKTTSLSQKTQDASSPSIDSFQYSGTIAQPGYDAPAHHRSMDYFIFSNSLADIQAAGLMQDPHLGASPLPAPGNLRLP
jgi:hypothetical protein